MKNDMQRIVEKSFVRDLGERIGYGNLIELAI